MGRSPAGPDDRALLAGRGDVRLDLGELLGGDEGAALDAVEGAPAEADGVGAAGQLGDEALADRVLDDQAGPGGADLATVEERGVQRLVDGGVEALVGGAGVGEDHVGVLAAELQGDLLHGRRGGPGHLRTAGEAAGEGDQVDVGVLGEPGAHRVARAGDEVGGPVGEPGLGEQLDQVDGGERGDLAGLEHEGVAGGEGRGDLPAGLEEG